MDKPNIKITYEIPDGATDQEKLSLAQMASIKLMLEEANYLLAQIAKLKSDEPGIESGIQAAKGILEELPERMHRGLADVEVGSAMREVRQLLDRSKASIAVERFNTDADRLTVRKARSEGGQSTALIKQSEKQERMKRAVKIWRELEGRPEHERAALIADRMHIEAATVRKYLREAQIKRNTR
tara:strand:+ start:1439 stop:1990 length:552 start_codon:yes stop_codon:yes gene_type:complete